MESNQIDNTLTVIENDPVSTDRTNPVDQMKDAITTYQEMFSNVHSKLIAGILGVMPVISGI